MSNLVNFSSEMTMSSVDIAELTGKRHDNVMRVANQLKEKGIIRAPQSEERYGNNNVRVVYQLNKTESLNLVANLSPEFTARIIERWQELEDTVNDPIAALNDPAKLRCLLLENVDKVIALEEENGELKPLAASYEHLTRSDGTLCVTDAAKALGVRRKDLFAKLKELRWIYRRPGGGHWIGYADKIQQGLLDHKLTEITTADGYTRMSEQVRITAKGMAKLGVLYTPLLAAE